MRDVQKIRPSSGAFAALLGSGKASLLVEQHEGWWWFVESETFNVSFFSLSSWDSANNVNSFVFADGNPGDETEMGSKKITIQVMG